MTTFYDSRNQRGNTKDRARRRQWLVDTFGDGKQVQCAFDGCSEMLTTTTVTVDRFPIPGVEGGRYVRGNIRPACTFHNSQDGSFIAQNRRMMREMKNQTQVERENNVRELSVSPDGNEVSAHGRAKVSSGAGHNHALTW